MPSSDNPRLILTPQPNEFILAETASFISALTELKFLGALLYESNSESSFECGDDFLHKISFLGCSPTLYSDAGSDLIIRVLQSSQLQFFHCHSMPPPRCPHCQKTDKNWSDIYQLWQQNNNAVSVCPHCQKEFNFSNMKWKKNGGYGKLLIQIHGIQEQLAVPNQTFLSELEATTDTCWEYFFAE
ncbi:MAG: hypothetical protein OEY36_13260 [Gammaproteobacteria bacterium]|nr:hypothetical protein [Gammaproteobacteria bacterium]